MARHELWVELADRPGNLAALAGDLAACGANIVHLDVHAGTGDTVVDRLVVEVPDERRGQLVVVAAQCGATLRDLDGDDADAGISNARRGPLPAVRRAARLEGSGPSPGRRPPTTLERLVALSDGGLVRLRHLSCGDRSALAAHHRRCSEEARRHSRFLSPEGLPTAPDSTTPDAPHDRVALAALVGGEITGVARYDLDASRTIAQVAVIVEDRHQRRGIGALLVSELAVLASNADVHHLRAVDPTGGVTLQRTLRRAGLVFTVRRDGDALVFDSGLPHGMSATA
jgi:GNAT superfamily N-acetyltransferase